MGLGYEGWYGCYPYRLYIQPYLLNNNDNTNYNSIKDKSNDNTN